MRLILAMLFAPVAVPTTASSATRIVLTGDSTVNDEGGWGTGFRTAFKPDVEVINLALNGRSSKSFRDEGAWAPALTAKADYILIQFGHNDSPGKGPERETDPATTYRANLIRFIDEARVAGATPVLVTSIVRRVFTSDGKIKPDSLVPYVEQTRLVAAEKKVPLVDLYNLTRQQCEQLGPERTSELSGTAPDGQPDTTHLGSLGRQTVGAIAAAELARVVPELRSQLR
jgi:pectinesterase